MSVAERSAAELLPWLAPLSDGVVACKDSSLLASFEFEGVDADSAGAGEVRQVLHAADRLLQSLRDLPVTLWWTVRRERSEDYPALPMPEPVSQLIDDEHRESVLSTSAYRNRHFFSLIWMPEASTASLFAKVGALTAEGLSPVKALLLAVKSTFGGRQHFAWRGAELETAVTQFEGRLSQCENIMSALNMRRLVGQNFMGFLWAQANPGLPMTPKAWDGQSLLDGLLSERPVQVYREVLQFGDGSDATYAGAVTLKSVPDKIDFNALGALLSLPSELVISHAFRVMSTQQADAHIDACKRFNDLTKYPLKSWVFGTLLRQGQMNESSVDIAKEGDANQTILARGALSSGQVLFGWHHLSVLLLDRDVDVLDRKVGDVVKMFHASPYVGALRESMHLLSSWATTLPGQWQECRRWLCLSSVNTNNMAPLLGVGEGDRYNEHLSAQMRRQMPALTVLRTDFNTPFYFNFHAGGGALAHTFVVGPSRSGKSAGMNFLISQFRKYGDAARVIIFDKDWSCRIATLLQGGEYIDLRADGDVRLNPLALLGNKRHWHFLSQWIEGLISSRGHVVTSEDAKSIAVAVESTAMTPDRTLHRLTGLAQQLPVHLRTHLEAWLEGGTYGTYFDNVEDSFSIADFCGIEMNDVMRDPRVAQAFLDYAFYRIQMMLESSRSGADNKVTMIYVEECWFMLQGDGGDALTPFQARVLNWIKTLPKLNAFVVLCTQSLDDLKEVPQALFAAFRDNMPTKIFLPNPYALSEDLMKLYKQQFLLRDDQIERIADAVPKLNYFIVQPGVSRMISLELNRIQLACVRSDNAAIQIFEPHFQSRHEAPEWRKNYIQEVVRA